VAIVNDTSDESDETIMLALSNPTNCSLGFNTNHTYTILDDDAGVPGVNNGLGAAGISSAAATLRGSVTDTGGENPTVSIYWGPTDGVTNRAAWSNSVSKGSLGLGDFSANVTALVAHATYYYRCYATNSAGDAWASPSERFVAEDPPSSMLIVNPSMETPVASGPNATNWTPSATNYVRRQNSNARSGTYSMEYDAQTNQMIYGSQSNAFRVSWGGLYGDAGMSTYPSMGVRPGFVLSGIAYVKSATLGSEAQFTYRWRNVDNSSNWMSQGLYSESNGYRAVSISNTAPIPPSEVGAQHRPELVRETEGGGAHGFGRVGRKGQAGAAQSVFL